MRLKSKLILPVLLAGITLLFGTTQICAQEPSPSASPATQTSKPTADEIAATLSRALDKVEALKKANEAKQELIVAQDEALQESEKAINLYKTASEANKLAADNYKSALETQTQAFMREEKRSRDLEKKLKGSQTKTRVAVIAGIAAGITLFLLK